MAARRTPPRVRARTGSVCVRVVLRRVVPCAAPEPLGAHRSHGTCPLCMPGGGGTSTRRVANARAHEDPAPGTEWPREVLTAPLRAPRDAPRGDRAEAQPPGTYGTSAACTPGGCGPLVRPVAVALAHGDSASGRSRPRAARPCPTRCAGARAPDPPTPLGARLSARREPGGLRTTARPVSATRARGALVSVSLGRLGHEKVSSNVRSCPGTPHKGWSRAERAAGSPRGACCHYSASS